MASKEVKMIRVTHKKIPMRYVTSLADEIFGADIFGYNPKDLISAFFDNHQVVIDDISYPVMDCHILNDGSMLCEIAVTSFTPEEISAEVVNNELIIKGKSQKKKRDDISKTLVNKIAKRDFEFRSFLSDKMDIDKIETNMKDGLLTVLIPLKEEKKPVTKKLMIK